jgi:DNA-binding transcriptional ArsR family regulator
MHVPSVSGRYRGRWAVNRNGLANDARAVRGSGFLDHPIRKRIYRHLQLLPGDYFRSIVRVLGLSPGTVRHHLVALVEHHLMEVRKDGRYSRFYPVGEAAQLDRNSLYADHWRYRDLRARILLSVDSLSDPRPSTVARKLGISRQLAAYHMNQLKALRLIERVGSRYRRTQSDSLPPG